jgi:endonuclease G
MKICAVALGILLAMLTHSTAKACDLGIPFNLPSVASGTTTEVCHEGYTAAVDRATLIPRWVAYRLTGDHVVGCSMRQNDFHADDQLPAGRRQEPEDYKGSGFDRGHQAPAEDFAWNAAEMSDSFSMANMAPQVPGLNREEWEHLEETVRAWAFARGELIVYVGPIARTSQETIGDDRVAVPEGFWKVVVDPASREALAFIMPQQAISKGDLRPWQTSIENVEAEAGVDLHLPSWINTHEASPLWVASIAGLRKEKKRICRN